MRIPKQAAASFEVMFRKVVLVRLLAIFALALHPLIGKAEPSSPIGGVYLDTFTGLSARAGYAFVVYIPTKQINRMVEIRRTSSIPTLK